MLTIVGLPLRIRTTGGVRPCSGCQNRDTRREGAGKFRIQIIGDARLIFGETIVHVLWRKIKPIA